MNQKWRKVKGAMTGIFFLALIFDSKLAVEGARSGIELCIKTVIPSLFPFFVLSIILTETLGNCISGPLIRILGISKSAASVLVPSVLGGYPVGAKCVGDLYLRNEISRNEANRLLAFCNNAGPSFLFGMVSGYFPERKMIWLLWGIHVFSAALTASVLQAGDTKNQDHQKERKSDENAIMLSAAKAMGLVCCWVIFFRTIITFLKAWFLWFLPVWGQVLIMGVLELTNGCCELSLISDPGLRFILCSGMLAFGGICVLFQTISVTNGLSIGYYVKGKLLQTMFSLILSYAVISKHGRIPAGFTLILVMIFRKMQKRDSNLRSLPV